MSNIKKQIKIYYISNAFAVASTSIVHSVLTVLLLTKGLTISNIAFVQMFYSLAIILSEFPSGVISDLYNRKKIFIFSKVILIIFFLCVFFFDNLYVLCFAWFSYGLSSAVDTGSIDSEIITQIKSKIDNKKNQEKIIGKFISNENIVNIVSMLCASTIGSFIYYAIGIKIYLISILLVIICCIILSKFFIANNKKLFKKNQFIKLTKKHIVDSFNDTKNIKIIRYIFILNIVAQFFFQTHFQLWQALFIQKNINEKTFFIYYIFFQIVGIFVSKIHLNKISLKQLLVFLSISIPFLIISTYIIMEKESILFLIVYYLFVAIFSFLILYYHYIYQKSINQINISSMTSINSMFARIGSVFSLFITSILLKIFSTQTVVGLNFLITIIITVVIFVMFFYKKNNINH